MQAIDFLDKLLRYDHQDRLTAREAMVNLCGLLTCICTPVYHIIIYEITCNAKLLYNGLSFIKSIDPHAASRFSSCFSKSETKR